MTVECLVSILIHEFMEKGYKDLEIECEEGCLEGVTIAETNAGYVVMFTNK